ncbi:RNA polymerase sigma-70 factor [Plebeiibacterium sediminum]|uniref:RNA polymerase sigma-70 factor n=1 Tax=Plebeiibacterium sediminum TaxID=2992112 RepID=A0AAE3SF23_9BACT|nr:RNA polymerase sigma-70 factor [Plebeiobacterium sediminum]MCW3786811.1 RNA polymerase sigma-70 factor [Plebeiobacterium sediminum]
MSHQKTNEILIMYKKDEKSAFKLLFDTYYIPLVLFANKMIQNEHSSEDIVQETLISFWQKKRFTDVKTDLDYYLFRSVKNKTLDYLKSKDRRQEVLMSTHEDYSKTELFKTEDVDEYVKLYKTIELLPQERRKIFKLVHLEGYKYKEVAEELGISVNTVQTQLRRSLQFLREQLTITNDSEENE